MARLVPGMTGARRISGAGRRRTVPTLAELIRDVSHPDIPADERFEANGELVRSFLDEISSPDQGAIREALPYLLTNKDLTAKSAQLMTDRLTLRTEPSSERWKVHGRKNGKEHGK